MGIRMVRQPSETPNITNIDDIIPFRYAYGDQNGYVIGKGQELESTILGNTIRINSGRVVLQGVETDIDANGVSFTIDNSSEKRYFVIYYEVNLATQTTAIKLSNYDINGYPTIDVGDDLTVNSSGIARLELYRFTANNGVISDIQRIVKPIEYSGTALVGYDITKGTVEERLIGLNNYDISKGTIEERLTSLGFNESSIAFSSTASTYIRTGSSVMTFKKLGKYVMVHTSFSLLSKFKDVINNKMLFELGTIPNGFLPKFESNTFIVFQYPFYIDMSLASLPTSVDLILRSDGTIDVLSDISLSTSEFDISGGYTADFWYEIN